jgi:hypothetical protein
VRGLGLLSGALLIVVLSLLSLGCAGGGKTIVAGGELRTLGDNAEGISIAEAKDGTLLLEWADERSAYESFARPGRGLSRASDVPESEVPRRTVAFNGRGERLAVWLGRRGFVFDVRRPGDETPSLRASLPTPVSEDIQTIGSSGCDFLARADGITGPNRTTYTAVTFLVRCKPHWSATRVRIPSEFGYNPAFDRKGNPGVFHWGRSHGRGLLLYATIRPDGRLNPPRRIALLTKQEEPGARAVVQGARDATIVWGADNGEIWQATPKGITRLSASKGSLYPDDGFDAISDEKGRAIVAWPTIDKYDRDTAWVTLPTANGRRTERAGSGGRPVLARTGKKLFVNLDLGAHRAIFARQGSVWRKFDLGEDRYSGATLGASGPRAVFAWTHNNYVSDQVDSTILYTWIYPRP